ncbi:MAG: cysteine protease StiP family protein [Pseudomonadota bacterium]|nr:cysteine protease StiP family protein [Pseudomonadota bacterium]
MTQSQALRLENPLPFSGSYHPSDAIFLLRPIPMPEKAVMDASAREKAIQSGKAHYSETIPKEGAPLPEYMTLFNQMHERYKERMAAEILRLAEEVKQRRGTTVTILSLARAGTPIGALLQRALRNKAYKMDVAHYAVSIIRDRGLDEEAIRHVLEVEGRPAESIIFVDGWTAKGAITRELKSAVAKWNAENTAQISDELYVVSDIGGTADVCATTDDYVMPSGILNSVVSGLVSRSALIDMKPGSFHTCVYYSHLQPHDISTKFLDDVHQQMWRVQTAPAVTADRDARHQEVMAYLENVQRTYGVSDLNRIKPGIAEATRALLRREPDILMLKDPNDVNVQHSLLAAQAKGIQVITDPNMPFNALTLIRDVT